MVFRIYHLIISQVILYIFIARPRATLDELRYLKGLLFLTVSLFLWVNTSYYCSYYLISGTPKAHPYYKNVPILFSNSPIS